MKLLITDNEAPLRQLTRDLITTFCPEISEVQEADGVQSGVEKILSFRPDILLLDVEMDDGSGFDLLQKLPSHPFQLIFITAHNDYAIKAFEFSAIDYLLKPIEPIGLHKAINRAMAQIKNKSLQKQIEVMMQQMQHTPETQRKIVLRDAEHIYFVPVADITYCLADGPYTRFHFSNGDPIMVSKNLKEYESLLEPFGFIRTHHSYLVNAEKITRFDKNNGGCLIIESHIEVPLSQRKKEQILLMLENRG